MAQHQQFPRPWRSHTERSQQARPAHDTPSRR
jgi:hypothetical protein